jgi:ribose-phosphate pyrophosphokinase
MADIVVFPDEGAQERYKDLLLSGVVVISAMKLRDRSTGKIITTAMPELPPGQSVLMVDDICDGGATFISLAKLMPDREISLYVSHGIFSKGTAILREAGIKRIFTKDGEQFEKA